MEQFSSMDIETAITRDGSVTTSTAGRSMFPMLRDRRDMVVVEQVSRPLKRFDVVLYRLKSGKLVLHRIIAIKDGRYIIRGDSLMKKETNVTDEMIIGVLREFYRNGKHYNCTQSRSYHAYVRLMYYSFPIRFVWRNTRPFLSRFKHAIFR